MERKKQVRDGSLKALVLGAGSIMITGAAESAHTGDIGQAVLFGALAITAFLIHEVLTQYQFAWQDEFATVLSEYTSIEPVQSDTDDENNG